MYTFVESIVNATAFINAIGSAYGIGNAIRDTGSVAHAHICTRVKFASTNIPWGTPFVPAFGNGPKSIAKLF